MALRFLASCLRGTARATLITLDVVGKLLAAFFVAACVVLAAVVVGPQLHGWVQASSEAALLVSSLLYNTCTSPTCRATVLVSSLALVHAVVLAVSQIWAWLRKDKRRIAELEQKIRQVEAEKHTLQFEVCWDGGRLCTCCKGQRHSHVQSAVSLSHVLQHSIH